MKKEGITLKTLLDKNFQYFMDCDYNTERHCDESCDPICRCSTIKNVKINSIDIDHIAKE